MQCPQCQCELKTVERQGIDIPFCPECRGIWLDKSGINQVMQQYMGERLRMMRRYEEYFDAHMPELDPPTELESPEERRREEMRRFEEIQFDPQWPQKPKERGGILNDIFDISDDNNERG